MPIFLITMILYNEKDMGVLRWRKYSESGRPRGVIVVMARKEKRIGGCSSSV